MSEVPLQGLGCGVKGVRCRVHGSEFTFQHKKVEIRIPGKGNSNSHGARPVN